MQIRYTTQYDKRQQTDTVENLILRACDGYEYGAQPVEEAARAARNTAVVLASLVEMLASRGVLSAEDVLELVCISAEDVEAIG